MNTLWNRLKPEYKTVIEEYIDSGLYKHGPQNIKKQLQNNKFWGELTVETVRDLFSWTSISLTDMDWEDMFGDRFLIENK
tara:strand:- start:205 stop:444 length:240 start_codon:yes stop_codon:yes gene_type:complete